MSTQPEIKMEANVTESINDLLDGPAKSIGAAASTALDFLHNTLFMPMQKYNVRADHNLEKFKKELCKESEKIPNNKKVDPSVKVWGQTLDYLKWNLDDDQEYIREMFINILLSDINSEKKPKVRPAFAEIVKQLSYDDAKLLEAFHKEHKSQYTQMEFRWKNKNSSSWQSIDFMPSIIILNENFILNVRMEVIDNLSRLGLIYLRADEWLVRDNKRCGAILEKIKKDNADLLISPTPSSLLDYRKTLIEITHLGQSFLDICMPKN